jgi:hypothetical protein
MGSAPSAAADKAGETSLAGLEEQREGEARPQEHPRHVELVDPQEAEPHEGVGDGAGKDRGLEGRERLEEPDIEKDGADGRVGRVQDLGSVVRRPRGEKSQP